MFAGCGESYVYVESVMGGVHFVVFVGAVDHGNVCFGEGEDFGEACSPVLENCLGVYFVSGVFFGWILFLYSFQPLNHLSKR